MVHHAGSVLLAGLLTPTGLLMLGLLMSPTTKLGQYVGPDSDAQHARHGAAWAMACMRHLRGNSVHRDLTGACHRPWSRCARVP